MTADGLTKTAQPKPKKVAEVDVSVELIGNSRGHKHGDVLEVSPAEAERLVREHLAKLLAKRL
jgi:hypothetical protein